MTSRSILSTFSLLLAALAAQPLLATAAGAAPPDVAAAASSVDRYLEKGWEAAAVTPAERSSDPEFLRRLYVDLVGRIPTAAEARSFLDARGEARRRELIDRLVASPEFASHQAGEWTVLLMGRGRLPRQVDRARFQAYLEERFAARVPFDRLVTELITADGNPVDNGAVNYLLRFELEPLDISESVAANFLGIQLGCARCHDHVYEPWTQEDFYGMAAPFATASIARPSRADRRARRDFQRQRREMQERRENASSPTERRDVMRSMRAGLTDVRKTLNVVDRPSLKLEAEIDGEERAFTARFLDGTKPKGAPREALARWVTSPENPYFSRAIVNRAWHDLFGRGLVHPVDAFGEGNPSSHPELLDFLADDFSAHGYDVARLYRVLTSSESYQRSSRYAGELPPDELFAVAALRRMSPEALFDSLLSAMGVTPAPRDRQFAERRELFLRQFVRLFDTDAVNDEEVARGTIPQALALLNGRVTNEAGRRRPRARIGPVADVETLFLQTLSRYPTPRERELVGAFVRDAGRGPAATEALEDLRWSLLNTSEFILVH